MSIILISVFGCNNRRRRGGKDLRCRAWPEESEVTAMGSFTGKLAVVTGGGYVIRNVSSPSGGSACTATWSTTA
jgi:hypothetical protein